MVVALRALRRTMTSRYERGEHRFFHIGIHLAPVRHCRNVYECVPTLGRQGRLRPADSARDRSLDERTAGIRGASAGLPVASMSAGSPVFIDRGARVQTTQMLFVLGLQLIGAGAHTASGVGEEAFPFDEEDFTHCYRLILWNDRCGANERGEREHSSGGGPPGYRRDALCLP
ncbi:MAG: hypothetical protein ACI8PT_002030 [Gammaproteobacteria bacterium]|jgi:hypothetical protein